MQLALAMLARFLRDHPTEAAREMEQIASPEAAAILADTPPEDAAPVLASMAALAAAESLERMEAPSAVALLCRLDNAHAASLLRRISLPSRESLLHAFPDPWRRPIRDALRVPALSIGGLVDPRALVFPDDWTAGEVCALLASRPALLAADVFVTGRDHRLRGRMDLRRLFEHGKFRTLAGIMQPDPPYVPLRAVVRFLLDDPLWQRFDVLPVVDSAGLFAGTLSHRALRSLEAPEAAGGAREPGAVFVEVAELAWTGCVAALDVAASITAMLPAKA